MANDTKGTPPPGAADGDGRDFVRLVLQMRLGDLIIWLKEMGAPVVDFGGHSEDGRDCFQVLIAIDPAAVQHLRKLASELRAKFTAAGLGRLQFGGSSEAAMEDLAKRRENIT